jgi:hypothetical protein
MNMIIVTLRLDGLTFRLIKVQLLRLMNQVLNCGLTNFSL